MSETKFCKDCKHYRGAVDCHGYGIFGSCHHPSNMTPPDPVYGLTWPIIGPEQLRKPIANCGVTAVWFEAKPPEPEPQPAYVIQPPGAVPEKPPRSWGWLVLLELAIFFLLCCLLFCFHH